MHLNHTQMQAVCHENGPCMVLAGPGSGKTTVITARVRAMIHEKGIPAEHILVITFTRAAAAEMKARFLKAEELNGTAVTFGTFHSVFLKVLRNHYDLPDSALASERRKRKVLSQIVPQTGTGADLVGILLSEISFVKNSLQDPAAFHSRVPGADFAAIYERYEQAMRRSGLLDYDDILMRTLELFRTEESALDRCRERFRYMLIDEFQDVNPLQYEIVKLLCVPQNNLFVVGDDDQSIYSFRSADPKIMLHFKEDYPETKMITLDVNYRCAKSIVAASSKLIRKNKARYPKDLKAAPGTERRGSIEKRLFRDEKEECVRICGIIEEGVKKGRKHADFAVLVRTAASAERLLQAFVSQKIPFRFQEKIPNLFQHAALSPVYAYLNWVLGDRSRDNFLKFMNVPVRYFRRTDLLKEQVDLRLLQEQFSQDPARSYMEGKTAFLSYQLDFLKRMRTPYAMINYIRKAIGYDDYLKEQAVGADAGIGPGDARGSAGTDVQEVLSVLDEVQESALAFQTAEEWYRYIVAYTKELERRTRAEKGVREDAVTVSTYHGAKGLEFPTVILPDVNERVTPHEKALTQEEIEEERRMFYVAMTRAVDELCLFSVRERFGKPLEISRFVKEME